MKRKIIIVSASVVVLALIVAMGIYAQGGSKSNNSTATEQTDKNVPDKCKKCPSMSKCSEAKGQTASACQTKCGDKKTCADASKCGDKKTCANASKCGDKKSSSDTTKCAGKKEVAKGCPQSSGCQKKCEKKSN